MNRNARRSLLRLRDKILSETDILMISNPTDRDIERAAQSIMKKGWKGGKYDTPHYRGILHKELKSMVPEFKSNPYGPETSLLNKNWKRIREGKSLKYFQRPNSPDEREKVKRTTDQWEKSPLFVESGLAFLVGDAFGRYNPEHPEYDDGAEYPLKVDLEGRLFECQTYQETRKVYSICMAHIERINRDQSQDYLYYILHRNRDNENSYSILIYQNNGSRSNKKAKDKE